MALLVALALFVAQAINLGLLLRDRAAFRLAQATRPAAVRIADALDREASGRPLSATRGRVRRRFADPITTAMQRQSDIASELATQLKELDVAVRRVDVAVAPPGTFPVELNRAERHMAERDRARPPDTLVIAVQQPDGRWLTMSMPWPSWNVQLFWRLLGQTVILYVVVLLPVLWIARRISRPLRELTAAARDYTPAEATMPLKESGPPDVRAVTTAFNALRLRVTAMLDEKDRMLGAIGHDLRTPLAALRVRIESVEDEQDRLRMVETIAEMNRMLDDILSLARLGRPSEPVTEVDLAALVDAVVEDFRDLGADVTFLDTDRLRMHLRPSLVRRAVRNLVENAVKYADGAEVSLTATDSVAAIIVADRGPGIPDDHLTAVFTPFTRLETSRNRDTGGIGLGLALAHAIIQEARGEITLAARPGGGLLATISLPRTAGGRP